MRERWDPSSEREGSQIRKDQPVWRKGLSGRTQGVAAEIKSRLSCYDVKTRRMPRKLRKGRSRAAVSYKYNYSAIQSCQFSGSWPSPFGVLFVQHFASIPREAFSKVENIGSERDAKRKNLFSSHEGAAAGNERAKRHQGRPRYEQGQTLKTETQAKRSEHAEGY